MAITTSDIPYKLNFKLKKAVQCRSLISAGRSGELIGAFKAGYGGKGGGMVKAKKQKRHLCLSASIALTSQSYT